jgi:hypothetical protein
MRLQPYGQSGITIHQSAPAECRPNPSIESKTQQTMNPRLTSTILATLIASIPALQGAILIDTVGIFAYSQNFDGLDVSADVATAGGGSNTPIAWNGIVSTTSWVNNSTYAGWTRQVKIDANANATDKDFIGEFRDGTTRFGNMGNGSATDGLRDAGPTTDRALGLMMQGNAGTGNSASFGLVFEIGVGLEIESATVGYNGEQWFRAGATSDDRLDFQYKILNSYNPATFLINDVTGWTDVNALDFAALVTGANGKLDGNANANRVALSSTFALSATENQFIAFRWTNTSDVTAAQAALAVDDVVISFSTAAIPEPSSAMLALLGLAFMLRRSRL